MKRGVALKKQIDEHFADAIEQCARKGVHPMEKLIEMATTEVQDPKTGIRRPLLVHEMGPEEGWKQLVIIWRHLDDKITPKIREQNTATVDYNISINIRDFTREGIGRTIEMKTAKPPAALELGKKTATSNDDDRSNDE